eukprot:GFUD01026756.1.p1 GENE.GFUD01026756.1~~GFUD01026756.1.p1  ORF type:complete len:459 (-),score=134.96 GFUD01026756.1:224-1600(-)
MNTIFLFLFSLMYLSPLFSSLPSLNTCWPDNWWGGCCYRRCNYNTQNVPQYPQQPLYYPQQHVQQYPPQYSLLQLPLSIQQMNGPNYGVNHMNTLNDDGIRKHYILNAKKVSNSVKTENQNIFPSIEEDIIVDDESMSIQNDAPVFEELSKPMKRPKNRISSNDDFFGSTEWLDSSEDGDIFTDTSAKLILPDDDDDDDFFSEEFDSFENFDESPNVLIEAVSDLPLCSDLSDIEKEIGVDCVEEKRNRDEVLEKILKQVWETLDISETLQPLIGDTLDPLNISRAIPGGEVSVNEEGSMYQANLTMRDITMYNLGQAYLKEVLVTRSEDLTNLEVTASFGLDLLTANGTYSILGMLGWWPVDSHGERSFHAEMYNATLAPRVRVDTRAGCDQEGNAIITDLKIPLVYDEVTFHMDNLGEFYNSVVNGIGVFLISTQNELAVSALKGLIARSISSFAC